jgi:hypothetical protein
MSKKLGAALAIALAMAWAQAHSAPVTYNVSVTGATSTLTGSITLVDGALGEIGRDEVLSWSFASVGDPAFSVSGSGGLPGVDCGDPSFCFFATASELSAVAPSGGTFGGVANEFNGSGQIFVGNGNIGWKCIGPFDVCLGSDEASLPADRVFARADPPVSVPEPGSLALAGAALAAAFVVAGRRNRRGSTAAT